MRRTIILVLALGVLPTARVAAKQGLRVPGEPVRVTAPGVPNDLVVSVVAVVADTLVVEHGPNTWRVPITSITRLEVKRGRRSHGGRGAAVGGLLGLVGGAVWGAVECSGQEDFIQYDPGTCAAIGGLVFGLGGLLAGAIV